MKPLEVWICQRAENLKKKSSKIPKINYAATMVSAARRQIIGGGAPINKSRRRRPQIVGGGGGGAARPAHGSSPRTKRYALYKGYVESPQDSSKTIGLQGCFSCLILVLRGILSTC